MKPANHVTKVRTISGGLKRLDKGGQAPQFAFAQELPFAHFIRTGLVLLAALAVAGCVTTQSRRAYTFDDVLAANDGSAYLFDTTTGTEIAK